MFFGTPQKRKKIILQKKWINKFKKKNNFENSLDPLTKLFLNHFQKKFHCKTKEIKIKEIKNKIHPFNFFSLWQWRYYLHRSTDSVSFVCGIFFQPFKHCCIVIQINIPQQQNIFFSWINRPSDDSSRRIIPVQIWELLHTLKYFFWN